MAEQLHAYIVALSFDKGPLHINALVAPDEIVAAAMAAVFMMQQTPTDRPLQGVVVGRLNAEFMAMALKAERGENPTGQVLSLVQPFPQAPAPDIGLSPAIVERPPMDAAMAIQPPAAPTSREGE